jgi:hypothetical protein
MLLRLATLTVTLPILVAAGGATNAAASPHSTDVNAAVVDAYRGTVTIKRVCEVVLQPHNRPTALAIVQLPGGKLDTVVLVWTPTATITPIGSRSGS